MTPHARGTERAKRELPPPGVLFGLALLVVLAIVPPIIGGYILRALTSYMIFGLLALAVGLITGYGRLFNLGVGANFGVSAYTVAILTHHDITNPFAVLAAALATGVLVALLFSFYALVASGIEYLMLTFLTTAAFAALPLTMLDLTGGDNGLNVLGGLSVSFGLNPLTGTGFYWFVLAIYASLIASLGGWLYALQTSFVFIDLLGVANSTNGLVYALIGGVDTILGPLLGAAILRSLTDQLSRAGTQSSLFIGIMLMLVVYLIPDGLLGLRHRYMKRRFAARGDRIVEAP